MLSTYEFLTSIMARHAETSTVFAVSYSVKMLMKPKHVRKGLNALLVSFLFMQNFCTFFAYFLCQFCHFWTVLRDKSLYVVCCRALQSNTDAFAPLLLSGLPMCPFGLRVVFDARARDFSFQRPRARLYTDALIQLSLGLCPGKI